MIYITVAELSVILVGFAIRGKAPQESNIFRNLLADGDQLMEEELMFRSPKI